MSNLTAFLTTIAMSEGVEPLGDRGYDVLVGSRQGRAILFTSYRDHPRIRVQLRDGLWSTAAGRYQILARIYDAYRAKLGLHDFSPDSQDRIAQQLIAERDALADVHAGRFDLAIAKCASAWASLPGAGYGQHENQLVNLRAAFKDAGGVFA